MTRERDLFSESRAVEISPNAYIYPEDSSRINKIIRDVGGYAWTLEEVLEILHREKVIGQCVRASDSHELVGFLAYNFDKSQGADCELPFFLVDPSWRSQKAGETLRDYIWAKAQRNGFHRVYVWVKASSVTEEVAGNEGYFQSLGFMLEETVQREDGEYYKMIYPGWKKESDLRDVVI